MSDIPGINSFSTSYSRSGFFSVKTVYTFSGPDGKPFLYASRAAVNQALIILPGAAAVFLAVHYHLLPMANIITINILLLAVFIVAISMTRKKAIEFSAEPGGRALFSMSPANMLTSADFNLFERPGVRFSRVHTEGGLKLTTSYRWLAEGRDGQTLLAANRPASIVFSNGPVPVTDRSGEEAGSMDISGYPGPFTFEFSGKVFETVDPRIVYGFALAVYSHALGQRSS